MAANARGGPLRVARSGISPLATAVALVSRFALSDPRWRVEGGGEGT